MGWLIALYIIFGLVTLRLFRNSKWRFIYSITWPLSLVIAFVCIVAFAIASSFEKFKLENM